MKKLINILILLLTLSLNFACTDLLETKEIFETFTIRKGEHSSGARLDFLERNKLTFKAYFDSSATYEISDPLMWNAKNKLLGFSDCNVQHHVSSARFAWQWMEDKLEIYAYTYVQGERQEAFIGTVEINTVNTYTIELTTDSYVFYLNNYEPVIMPRVSNCDKGAYYMLWPYFGGQIPAPHDIEISIAFIYN